MNDLSIYHDELAKCSKCGFCQAFCPVYAVTGTEPMTARGRNAQLMGVIEGKLSLYEIENALGSCLLCKACVPSCFSGIKTDELVRRGREAVIKVKGPGVLQKIIFYNVLFYPLRVTILLRAAYFFKKVGLIRLTNMLQIAPKYFKIADILMKGLVSFPLSKDVSKIRDYSQIKDRDGKGKKLAAYFLSCGFNHLLPEVGRATIKVIEALGYEVVVTSNNCCGLPPYAHGYTDEAKKLARKNIEALEGFETILTDCGSCSSFLKKYGELLSDDPEYVRRAKRLSERVVDSNEFIYKSLLTGTVPNLRPFDELMARNSGTVPLLKVTYHDPCHLSRYQGVTKEPREILKAIPEIDFIELPEADWCCGGAGTYSIMNNDISMKILDRKIDNVRKTGAALLITSCPACMIQLSYGIRRAGLDVRVMHINQLLAGLSS